MPDVKPEEQDEALYLLDDGDPKAPGGELDYDLYEVDDDELTPYDLAEENETLE